MKAPHRTAAAAEKRVISILIILMLCINIVYKVSTQYCKMSLHKAGSGERKRDALLRHGALWHSAAELDRGKADISFCARFLMEGKEGSVIANKLVFGVHKDKYVHIYV